MRSALDARELVGAMRLFEAALREHRDEIDSLNVYPVPDGDTGTNLLLTQRRVTAALDALPGSGDGDGPTLVDVCRAISEASLLGARGNSGVILSQVLRGLCEVLAIPGGEVAAALEHAANEAYQAVVRPAEGTILTVLRDAAAGAREATEAGEAGAGDVLEAALGSARVSLARTPELLPELRQAGVVDAGGRGAVLLFDALCAAARGTARTERPGPGGPVRLGRPEASSSPRPGAGGTFEVQLLLDLDDGAVASIRERLVSMGDSLVVVGGGGLYSVHVHTAEPDEVIAVASSAAGIRERSVTPLANSLGDCLAIEARGVRVAEEVCGLVAVAEGEGLVRAFQSLGAIVVRGGAGNNPSVEVLASAVMLAPGGAVLLPNHPNILPAAERAVRSAPNAALVPATSAVSGLAAAAAFNPLEPLDRNVVAMRAAAAACRTGEATHAVRGATTPLGDVAEGDWLGLAEGELVSVGPTAAGVLAEVLRHLLAEAGRAGLEPELATIVVGEDASPGEAGEVRSAVEAAAPGLEVQRLEGGQPRYPFLIGVE